MAAKLKLKKGDRVIVVAGKDKGKSGDVLKMFPKENRAVVSGVKRRAPSHEADCGTRRRHRQQGAVDPCVQSGAH